MRRRNDAFVLNEANHLIFDNAQQDKQQADGYIRDATRDDRSDGQWSAQQIDGPMSINALLKIVEIPGPYLAVEVNEDVVPKELHDDRQVADGDRIEVVTLVGGG
ncbi:MAG: sulfur carrier protein ThiS [Pirellulaceae bacterium]